MTHLGGASTPERMRFVPDRGEVVDGLAVLTLCAVALFEFRSTFTGWTFFAVAIVGLLLGLLIAHISNALRQPVIVLVALGVATFFLLGGAVVLRQVPGASSLPTPETLRGLAGGAVHGWRNLLTTLPPVEGHGPLLVIPYILGLFGGLCGLALARRSSHAALPAMVPLVVFVSVILLGSPNPQGIAVTATAFAVLAFVWMAARQRRSRTIISRGSGKVARVALSVGLLAITAFGADLVGPHVPGADAHERLVLRDKVRPPNDLGTYPSPLSEFRLYAAHPKDRDGHLLGLVDDKLFTVGGNVPVGTPIRLATLNAYSGLVWTAAQVGGTTDRQDAFLKVGPTLDNPAPGPSYSMSVDVDAYDDYWLPTAGALQALTFTGPGSKDQTTTFRYNLQTGTGVVPLKLRAGSSYRMTVAGVRPRILKKSDALSQGGSTTTGAFLAETAKKLGGTAGPSAQQVLNVADKLRNEGRWTDGDTRSGFEYYLPGHSQARLQSFVKGVVGQPFVGDDEQYAAAYALMIENLGVPARVVVGAWKLPPDRVVKGGDISAWVEVQAAVPAEGWYAIPTSMFEGTKPPDQNRLQQRTNVGAGSNVPPPPQGHPQTPLNAASQSDSKSSGRHSSGHGPFHLPRWLIVAFERVGVPLLILVAALGSIVGVKALRRRRRRLRGSAAARLAGGWREVTDHARDLGVSLPVRATRREEAAAVGNGQVEVLARNADAHIFGEQEIVDHDVLEFWNAVSAARAHLTHSVGRWQRLRAAVNLATFFPRLPGASS